MTSWWVISEIEQLKNSKATELEQFRAALDKKAVDSNKSLKEMEGKKVVESKVEKLEKIRLVSLLSESKKELEYHSSLARSLQSEIKKLNKDVEVYVKDVDSDDENITTRKVKVPQHNPPVEQIHPGCSKNDHQQEEVGGLDQLLSQVRP
jgi:hypothetical protein